MAKWASAALLDGGLTYLNTSATTLLLVKAYAAGDSYATVQSNKVAEVAMTPTDLPISASGSNRRVVSASKTANATANSGATPDLHFVFCTGSAVVYATDETTDQVITNGNPVQFPALTYTSFQPT